NGKPVKDFWKEVDARRAAHTAWCKQVATLPAARQVQAVAARLKSLNPNFNGNVQPTIAGGVVTGLKILTDQVTDLSPVRALTGLQQWDCAGSGAGKGTLADLWPLHGLRLQGLNCSATRVADLAPLRGMPLTALWCNHTSVASLAPLKGLRLTYLACGATP